METIYDCPGFTIYKPYEGRKFRHGDKIAIPYESRRHGTLWHFYTLGTVAGYAVHNGEDPIEAVEDCKRKMIEQPHNGHKLYWANANAVCISNQVRAKDQVPGFNWGDEIILQGKRFTLAKAPNDNCSLVPVD